MSRRNVEVRREEILLATLAQAGRLGMDQLRVQDVAKSLGVSTGLVFYHFDTKDKLLAAALEHAVDRDLARLDRAVARGSDPLDRLRRVISSYGPTGAASGWTLWIDAWAMALRHPPIRTTLRRLDGRWRAALRDAIVEGTTTGDFTCPDPAATVARIGGLLDGLSVAALVYRNVRRAQLRTWMREAVAAELGLDPSDLT
ncbi:MAG: TetR family transcriptional regulator [Nocardioidaceae bacterium]|nr:TetR family transcriptional regulator [Nocardioidaceae bacterium]